MELRTERARLFADLTVGAALAYARYGDRDLREGFKGGADYARRIKTAELEARDQVRQWLDADLPDDSFRRAPLHWPLVFPEVFENGGFDAVIGNPPFLGGQKLTGALGTAYREHLVHGIGNSMRGSADLIAYFALRAHGLLNKTGQTGLIATNTLAQGDTREVGLDQLIESEVRIRRSIKSERWPCRSAALEYCVIWCSRAELGKKAEVVADGVVVAGISSSLNPESRVTGNPQQLAKNAEISFVGSYVLGLGFTLQPERARELINKAWKNNEVLFPYLNGQDLNSRADVSASRWVINFFDWPECRAASYPECYKQVAELVKPECLKVKFSQHAREHWWQYERRRPELYETIADLKRVIVLARTSRTAMPIMVSTGYVFNENVVVFATEDSAILSLLSSALHYRWAVDRCATLRSDLQYARSDVFKTFPLPGVTEEMRELGDRLDALRRDVMLARDSGLTRTYNLIFEPTCTDEDIEELRRIHREIDEATIRAYGWEDRIERVGGLNHGFHRVGRETRYTIGPAAQREILDSLLELNHERYAQEVAQGLHAKNKNARRVAGEQEMLL